MTETASRLFPKSTNDRRMKQSKRTDMRLILHIYSRSLQLPVFFGPDSKRSQHPATIHFMIERAIHRLVSMSIQHFMWVQCLMHNGCSANLMRDARSWCRIQRTRAATTV